jgi:2-methylisocitrate lyase-like PEP mutase family enzyme
MPKRCGHMAGKQVVPSGEMVAKVHAAVEARTDPDLLLIARTDARAPHGLDDALRRARAYREAGADMLFVEALEGVEEIELVARELADVPLLFNWVEGGRTPPLPYERLAELGYALVIFPIGTLLAATAAVQRYLDAVRRAGSPLPVLDELPGFDAFLDVIGLAEIGELERRFADDAIAPTTTPVTTSPTGSPTTSPLSPPAG